MATNYGLTAPSVAPGEEPLAQTQNSILTAINTAPVSSPAPVSYSIYSEGTPNLNAMSLNQTSNTLPENPSNTNAAQEAPSFKVPVSGLPSNDWRLTLKLAPNSTYLYNAPDPGILAPLKGKGVIFPYTPSINMNYTSNYEPTDLTHSNYKIYQYKNSSVGEITIQGDFTAQDTSEANYLLAVIHFFRSATKMFYGQDKNPPNGTPPPLCYLSGFGQYQFDKHPVAISSFSYHLPADVDYIKAGVLTGPGPTPSQDVKTSELKTKVPPSTKVANFVSNFVSSKLLRLESSKLKPNAKIADPVFKANQIESPTYVPTKISINLTLLPIVNRYDTSQRFSLEKYAEGTLYSGSLSNDKGIW
jgi:hypothetical protein